MEITGLAIIAAGFMMGLGAIGAAIGAAILLGTAWMCSVFGAEKMRF